MEVCALISAAFVDVFKTPFTRYSQLYVVQPKYI